MNGPESRGSLDCRLYTFATIITVIRGGFLLVHISADTRGMIVKGTECFVAVVTFLYCVQSHTVMTLNLLALSQLQLQFKTSPTLCKQ